MTKIYKCQKLPRQDGWIIIAAQLIKVISFSDTKFIKTILWIFQVVRCDIKVVTLSFSFSMMVR